MMIAMTITTVADYLNRDTVLVLEQLLVRARSGELRGVTICTRPDRGADELVLTGIYRNRPEKAVNACVRMAWRLSQLQDDLDEQQA